MLKTLSTTALTLSLITFKSTAQIDAGNIDLGYTSVNKHFTQHATIKASDLERVPFATIEEAINVYFNGIYINKRNIIYVIDGNISNTVDALPVNDIETITLVQNAQSIINGAYSPNQLIVIKTKPGARTRSGISATASLYYTKLRSEQNGKFIDQIDPTLFHNYSITANKITSKSEFGATINFLRQSMPLLTQPTTLSTAPHRINRLRGNAWFSTKLGRFNLLTIRAAVMPQDSASNHHFFDDVIVSHIDYKNKQLFVYPSLQLTSRLSRKFFNHFNASYNNMKSNIGIDGFEDRYGASFVRDTTTYNIDNTRKQMQLLLRNRIEYRSTANHWTFNPAINLLYVASKSSYGNKITSYSRLYGPYMNTSSGEQKDKEWAITPSVNLSYKAAFSITAGVQYNSSRIPFFSTTEKRWYPFASTTVDLLALGKTTSKQSLKIFASYAQASSEIEKLHYRTQMPFYFEGVNVQGALPPSITNFHEPSTLIMLGADWDIAKNGLKFSYNYSNNKFHQLFKIDFFSPMIIIEEMKISAHRFGIDYKVIDKKDFTYRTSVAAFYSKTSEVELGDNEIFNWYFKSLLIPDGVSGGLVNHLRIGRFTAGVNALYSFRDEVNSILLQHVYAGYKVKKMEVYLSGRNLLQNKKSIISTGYMVFYGAGVNVGL